MTATGYTQVPICRQCGFDWSIHTPRCPNDLCGSCCYNAGTCVAGSMKAMEAKRAKGVEEVSP